MAVTVMLGHQLDIKVSLTCLVFHLVFHVSSYPPSSLCVPSVNAGKSPPIPYVYVNSSGSVKNYRPMQVVLACSIEMYAFPFDKQNCSLTFRSWLHSGLCGISGVKHIQVTCLYVCKAEFSHLQWLNWDPILIYSWDVLYINGFKVSDLFLFLILRAYPMKPKILTRSRFLFEFTTNYTLIDIIPPNIANLFVKIHELFPGKWKMLQEFLDLPSCDTVFHNATNQPIQQINGQGWKWKWNRCFSPPFH